MPQPVERGERWRVPIDADRLRDALPHRWPFLYLDRVVELDPGCRGVGVKNVTIAEPYFAGHFPHESIVPGVLIIESLAQLAGIVVGSGTAARADRGYLAAVNRMRFRVPVRPGDQLVLVAETNTARGGPAEVKVTALVDNHPVADGRLIVA